MSAEEARVLQVGSANTGQLAYLLYLHPSMRLHEEATRFISELSASCSRAYQRNVAYALSHWHNYCLGRGISFKNASLDELAGYKRAMLSHVSPVTGQVLSAGTVGQRLTIVANYYISGQNIGWNHTASALTDITKPESPRRRSGPAGSLAIPITSTAKGLVPRHTRTKTDIRPLSPNELSLLLQQLGPDDDADKASLVRDRLVAEWLAYCGLRLHEVLGSDSQGESRGLAVREIEALPADPNQPFDHCILKVIGKGNRSRNIAVPNWLVNKTQRYIMSERAAAIGKRRSQLSSVFVNHSGANGFRGSPLSTRRFQAIFESACLRCGLTKQVNKYDSTLKKGYVVSRARHSPHDLRHTYAVMTYHAESINQNSEPWKLIQAQLGHRHLQTTVDTYLSFVSLHGSWKDLRTASLREMAGIE